MQEAEAAINITSHARVPLALINTINDNEYGINDPHVSVLRYNTHALAKAVADEVNSNGIHRPVCFSEKYTWNQSYFCDIFYDQLHNPPPKNQVVHLVDITRQSNVDNDVSLYLNQLAESNYKVDAVITLSEYIFNSLNMRMLQNITSDSIYFYSSSDTFNQKQAMIDSHLDKAWYLNTFALGFISLLHIIINKQLPDIPWKHTYISTDKVNYICPPGTYYNILAPASFCIDNENEITSSIQCVPCPFNNYNNQPDQKECQPCKNGTIPNSDATMCVSCYDPSASSTEYCSNYIMSQNTNQVQLPLAISLPIIIVILLLIILFIIWKLRKRKKKKFFGPDGDDEDTWLLSYNNLMFPSMRHLPSDYEYKQKDKVSSPPNDPNSIPSTSASLNSILSPSMNESSTNNNSSGTNINTISNNNNTINSNNNNNNNSDNNNNDSSTDVAMEEMVNKNNDSTTNTTIKPPHPHFTRQKSYISPTNLQDSLTESHTHWALFRGGKANKIKDPVKNDSGSSRNSHIALPLVKSKILHNSTGQYHNLYVSIKQIGFKPLKLDKEYKTEIQLLKHGRCPNLSEFIGICIENHGTYLVEEYCRKGSLDKILANEDINLTWIFRFSLMNDLLQGMQFIHRSKINTHGLLTSACCMVTGRWELKISDYGLRKTRQTQYEPSVISAIQKYNIDDFIIIPSDDKLLWMAPESILSIYPNLYITIPSKQADVYSVGVIMNEILTRSVPYNEYKLVYRDDKTLFQRIKAESITPVQNNSATDYFNQVNRIIRRCWYSEPEKRPCIGELKNLLHNVAPLIRSDNMVENLALMLEEYANGMEDLVYKRTSNLLQRTMELEEERARTQILLKDLKAAKEKAEAGARSKQNFLANMSHEIRTPMNAVIGMSHILMESDLPPELYDCVETIEFSGNHLIAIIDDILDYSKIESGKLSLENNALDLSFVIESAIKLVAPNYLAKGIALWYTVDPKIPVKLMGDVVRLRQIILNLLSNALKFTSSGGYVNVEVNIINEEKGISLRKRQSMESINMDDYVPLQISIRDTGIGIHQDKISSLFKSFSQVDASTTRNFGGTGLGLAISRQLCRMMYGDMWVNSEFGIGSTFTFQILLQKQSGSSIQTYEEQQGLSKIVDYFNGMMVIAEQKHVSKSWKKLLEYMNINDLKVFTFAQANDYFTNHSQVKKKVPLLIVDADYATIDGIEPKESITTSRDVIIHLRNTYSELRYIPTLCINDIRLKRQSSLIDAKSKNGGISSQPNTSTHYQKFDNTLSISHEEILKGNDITPISLLEERSPFDLLTTILYKPLKNSILFAAFHQVIDISKKIDFDHISPATAKFDLLNQYDSNRNSFDASYFTHHINSHKIFDNNSNTNNNNRSNIIRSVSSDDIINKCKQPTCLPITFTLPNTPTSEEMEKKNLHNSNNTSLMPSTLNKSTNITINDLNNNTNNTSINTNDTNSNNNSINILLVDDNPVNRKVLNRLLDKLGLKCRMAQDGKEACEMVQQAYDHGKPFDLIFMDIWMPQMNGFEATISIRKSFPDHFLKPYIVALTACVTPDDRQKCKDAGMNDFLSKPVRKPELVTTINEFKQQIQEMRIKSFQKKRKVNIINITQKQQSPPVTTVTATTPITIHKSNNSNNNNNGNDNNDNNISSSSNNNYTCMLNTLNNIDSTITMTYSLSNSSKDDIDSRRP
ncbi:unnamed protein product [Cunninghamella blakesleeana]